MITEEHFQDLARHIAFCRGYAGQRAFLSSVELMYKIVLNAANGKTDPVKEKPIVLNLINNLEGVQVFFLKYFPFERIHLREAGLNEFVLKPKQNNEEETRLLCYHLSVLASKVLQKNDPTWWENLNISIKVATPNEELKGNFTETETIQDVRLWISRKYFEPFVLAASWDNQLIFEELHATLKDCDLNRKKLVLKQEGDLGRSKMDEIEIKRKMELDAEIKRKLESSAKAEAERIKLRDADKKRRETALQNFSQDRIKVNGRKSTVSTSSPSLTSSLTASSSNTPSSRALTHSSNISSRNHKNSSSRNHFNSNKE